MCGIIGAVVPGRDVTPLLLQALHAMEYRGYDSAGICLIEDGRLCCRKEAGKLARLEQALRLDPVSGACGIGHTRWATHGAPSACNAHPHLGTRWAVVHNGIIENHRPLRDELEGDGVCFRSETDSEVLPWLIERQPGPAEEAWRALLGRLQGAFAIVALSQEDPDALWFARRGSPLLLARAARGVFVASDAISVAPLADEVLYLEEGEWGRITPTSLALFDASGRPVVRDWHTTPATSNAGDKGGFEHYMDKEIHEQPDVIERILSSYTDGSTITFPRAPWLHTDAPPDRIVMVACGTSYHAALAARYWLEGFLNLPVEVDVASEYRYRNPVIGPNTLLVTLSQSGETADTLEALRLFRQRTPHNRTLTLCNVDHSSMVREADGAILLHAGAEIGVASTKAFTAQLAVLALFSLALARRVGSIDDGAVAGHLAALRRCSGAIREILRRREEVVALIPLFLQARGVLFLGRGACYPLALEGALKLKEISYMHAEGYAAGEMKHGPIALVDRRMPVVVLALRQYHLEKVLSNLREVQARGARVILLTDEPDGAAPDRLRVAGRITIPQGDLFTAPILAAIPLQLLAYHVARAKGTDIDQPRNLAKSVTVE
ncbi:MAG: glutamine--fructose-6-phosphate transaminase (isomerizing) [Zetaproteobacteria bacterium]|nr:MAG: glutamine--fructose-6-phosphate transaminase (isomerizing) [Zetaproteobacteria bacterium]